MTEKPKPRKTTAKRAPSRKSKSMRGKPTHSDVSERAYYIHLEEPGSDEVANWLRAERELMVA